MKTYEDLKQANESIQTTDIKGKDYAEVNQRVKAFRMVYPEGTIETELVYNENGMCIFKAYICNDGGKLLGTGTAYERENSSFINKTSYIENCETSAVGRALGMCGFGIDTAIRSAEEEANAEMQQEQMKTEDISNQKISEVKVKALEARCKSDGVSVEKLLELYKVKTLADLTEKKFANIHEHWDKIKA